MPPVCVGSLFAFGNQLSIDVELAATLVGFAGTLTGRVTTASPELTVLATN